MNEKEFQEYRTIKINSSLELPFQLLDIQSRTRHFTFEFVRFDERQSDYSIKNGGVTGEFGIRYICSGLTCDFVCDVTVGNVYEFYQVLKECYDNVNGTAVLQDYSGKRTKLAITFDHYGYCSIEGAFQNVNDSYESGVSFQLDCDQTCIKPALGSFHKLFAELSRLQGFEEFLY